MSLSALPRKINYLDILIEKIRVGTLTYASTHMYQPVVENQPISLTMTRPGLESYQSGAIHPIFSQNLPEGANLTYITNKLARYAKVNAMYLLALQGDQGIGLLEYQSELALPNVASMSLKDILSYQSAEPLFPQLLEQYYLRNSLAGMQPKVSLPASTVDTNRIVMQRDLIVKSFDEEFPLLTVNEYVCMEAARYCGLMPPKTYLSDNLETFVIERFDKRYEDQRITKLGYEDFTTLLKKANSPDEKYSGSYETVLKATLLYTRSRKEVEKMYRYIVFNCLIGNGDAHLKNFALQYEQGMDSVIVSPPFDITHTPIYETINNDMALKLSGSKKFPDKPALVKLAQGQGYRIDHPETLIDEMAQKLRDYLGQSDEIHLFKGLRESIEKSIDTVMSVSYTTKGYRRDRKLKFE